MTAAACVCSTSGGVFNHSPGGRCEGVPAFIDVSGLDLSHFEEMWRLSVAVEADDGTGFGFDYYGGWFACKRIAGAVASDHAGELIETELVKVVDGV